MAGFDWMFYCFTPVFLFLFFYSGLIIPLMLFFCPVGPFKTVLFSLKSIVWVTVFSIWCVRLHPHTLAYSPLVWCVYKIACPTSVYDTYCLRHWNEENERKIKKIKFNGWSFFLNLVNLSLAWMFYLPVWLQNKRKILSLEWIL